MGAGGGEIAANEKFWVVVRFTPTGDTTATRSIPAALQTRFENAIQAFRPHLPAGADCEWEPYPADSQGNITGGWVVLKGPILMINGLPTVFRGLNCALEEMREDNVRAWVDDNVGPAPATNNQPTGNVAGHNNDFPCQ